MSLSKSKCWYSNNCLHFLKSAVPLWSPHSVLRTEEGSVRWDRAGAQTGILIRSASISLSVRNHYITQIALLHFITNPNIASQYVTLYRILIENHPFRFFLKYLKIMFIKHSFWLKHLVSFLQTYSGICPGHFKGIFAVIYVDISSAFLPVFSWTFLWAFCLWRGTLIMISKIFKICLA